MSWNNSPYGTTMLPRKKFKAVPTVRKIDEITDEIVMLSDGDLRVGSEVCIRTVRQGKTEAIWLRLKNEQAVADLNSMFPNVVSVSFPA
jgi:hypothetical protein